MHMQNYLFFYDKTFSTLILSAKVLKGHIWSLSNCCNLEFKIVRYCLQWTVAMRVLCHPAVCVTKHYPLKSSRSGSCEESQLWHRYSDNIYMIRVPWQRFRPSRSLACTGSPKAWSTLDMQAEIKINFQVYFFVYGWNWRQVDESGWV